MELSFTRTFAPKFQLPNISRKSYAIYRMVPTANGGL